VAGVAGSSAFDVVAALHGGTSLSEALATALDDPSLEVLFHLDASRGLGTARWVDTQGRRVPEPRAENGRALRLVEHGGETIAALLYDGAVVVDDEAVDEATAAATLAFQAERLYAELRSEGRLAATLAETAPALLSNVDVEGRILELNDATLRASGYSSEDEVRGKYFWEVFIDPDEREEMIARFHAAAPTFAPAEYENTFTNVRGEHLVIYWRSAPVLDDQGQVESIVAAGLDLTDRYVLEEEKQREREFLYAIANNAPSLLCVIDERGRVVRRRRDQGREGGGGTNIAFEQLLGYDPGTTGGLTFWEEFVDPADADEVRDRIQRVIAGERPEEHDNLWLTSSGDRLHVAWSCTPLPEVDERTLFLVSGSDVSERKQRELEVQRARDFLQTVVTTIPSLLVVVDPDARITENGVNREFSSTFGWSLAEATGRSFLELVHPDDDYTVRMAIAAAANGVPRTDLEARWLTQDGEDRVVAWTATPTRDREGRLRVLLSGMDVTDRKRQEEEIRASRARLLQAESQTRRQLERNLHDGAQQRLVALSVQLRLIEARLRESPQEAAELLVRSREELAHALEELRELARGIHPAILTDRGLGPALEALAARAPIPIEVIAPAERQPSAVEAAVYYVVAEALTNTAKYARASSAVVHVTREQQVLVVVVTDDGVGGADPGGGSGLRGLVDRVEALDGTLEIESPPGEGTMVRAVIPLPEEPPTEPRA
jgi:PAS domain S-box-containing protein